MGIGNTIAGQRARLKTSWQSLSARRPSLGHLVAAYQRYKKNNGDHLAAAITYFSFLALFPLILLGVSIVGFILAGNSHLENELFDNVARNVPGQFGNTVTDAINSAVKFRTRVGVIGLVGVALAGLGWIANLRTAIDTVWGLPNVKRSFVGGKAADALVLIGLGLGVVVSLALTAGGTSASGFVLRTFNLDDVTGAGTATRVLGVLLGILGSMVIFGWLLIRLPAVEVSRTTAWRTTLLAAVGFELLKVIGSVYIARVTKSPAVAVIGPILGVLVWIDLVSRYLLYCVAWAATANGGRLSVTESVPSEAEPGDHPLADGQAPGKAGRSVSPVGLAAGLFSAGAAIGGASVAVLQRRHRRLREPQ